MPHTFDPQDKRQNAPSFHELWQPVETVFVDMPPLEARGNKPLQLNFEHQLKSLVFYHLEEHTSERHLLQVLEEDDFAREVIAPPKGIKKSSFFEAINSRGLEQLTYKTAEQLKAAQALHRKALWRLLCSCRKFNGLPCPPQEAARILGEAIDYARQGQLEMLKLETLAH